MTALLEFHTAYIVKFLSKVRIGALYLKDSRAICRLKKCTVVLPEHNKLLF